MKKNLISIIILALLIVNIVLTAIMMFSVTGTATKTSALVDNITRALNLELTAKGDAGASAVPISDIATYDRTSAGCGRQSAFLRGLHHIVHEYQGQRLQDLRGRYGIKRESDQERDNGCYFFLYGRGCKKQSGYHQE